MAEFGEYLWRMEQRSLIHRLLMSFRNPVYPHEFADPFVLKFLGSFWGYCTGFQPDGRVFGIIRSEDLIHWDYSGGAMDPLPGGHTCYWAPEVTYEDDGSFHLYYSVGNEENMEIRVARAEHPAGPFFDVGVRLTHEPFAIDAHVFKDDDGSRYLFYATDFLTHTHIGTGTVVARMKDPYSLEAGAVPVTRAKYDWQVYDPKRESKGGVRWHTVEGPFVLKRKERYYEMFSGGNWQNITYGVSFATSSQVERDNEWDQHADGDTILPILRTIPGKVIGPGHNSVVRGPNNRDLYCIYHEWINNERVLAIDRLDWNGPDLLLLGPTLDEQHGPFRAITAERDSDADGNTDRINLSSPSLLLEFSVSVGLYDRVELMVVAEDGTRLYEHCVEAGAGFSPDCWHTVRVELDGRELCLTVGEQLLRTQATMTSSAQSLHVRKTGAPKISALQLTEGWEELFVCRNAEGLRLKNWTSLEWGTFAIVDNELRCTSSESSATIVKPLSVDSSFEAVVNARLVESSVDTPRLEIILGDPADELIVSIDAEGGNERARVSHKSVVAAEDQIRTATGGYHQIRILYLDGVAQVMIDGSVLTTVSCSSGQQLALRVVGSAAFDMVRVTGIPSA